MRPFPREVMCININSPLWQHIILLIVTKGLMLLTGFVKEHRVLEGGNPKLSHI